MSCGDRQVPEIMLPHNTRMSPRPQTIFYKTDKFRNRGFKSLLVVWCGRKTNVSVKGDDVQGVAIK